MLRQLHVSHLGVIADIDLELHPGLNVLTGETGAGKTMLTVAISMAVGGRAHARIVREGAAAAGVQAVFDAPAAAEGWAEDGELVLARSVGADGRSQGRAGGQITTASTLAELGGRVVEIHGQHQTLGLMDPAVQTGFLDRFAGEEHVALVDALEVSVARLRATETSARNLAVAARERERELDLLAYQIREIEGVGPQPGESLALQAEEARLSHVERLVELVVEVQERVSGDGGSADDVAATAASLEAAASLDPEIGDLAERARGIAEEVADIGREVRGYRETLVADPARLQEVRDRTAALKALQRKYGATEDEVLGFARTAGERLSILAGADERLAELLVDADRARGVVAREADQVTRGREAVVSKLAEALTAELHELGMPTASISVELEPLDACGPRGAERAVLCLSPSEGQAARPLARSASGGELSRVMLACRSVLADLDDVPTLVFDEVDAGIGGQAGLAVGRRLARLAARRQVLVVTHLPQIACFADRHVAIRKRDGAATATVLEGQERIRDLSRMLAGLEGSEHAASHAEELLAEASSFRATPIASG